jgi:hypothetical protein
VSANGHTPDARRSPRAPSPPHASGPSGPTSLSPAGRRLIPDARPTEPATRTGSIFARSPAPEVPRPRPPPGPRSDPGSFSRPRTGVSARAWEPPVRPAASVLALQRPSSAVPSDHPRRAQQPPSHLRAVPVPPGAPRPAHRLPPGAPSRASPRRPERASRGPEHVPVEVDHRRRTRASESSHSPARRTSSQGSAIHSSLKAPSKIWSPGTVHASARIDGASPRLKTASDVRTPRLARAPASVSA